MDPAQIASNAIELFMQGLEDRGLRLNSVLSREPIEETVRKAKTAALHRLQEGSAEMDENWPGMHLEIRWEAAPGDNDLRRSMISKALALRFSRREVLEGVITVTHVGRWLIGGDGQIRLRRDDEDRP